jgi:hypothetical protein
VAGRIRRRLIVGTPSVGRPTWRRRSWGRRCGPVPSWVRPCAHRPCAGDPSDRRSCRSPETVPLLHFVRCSYRFCRRHWSCRWHCRCHRRWACPSRSVLRRPGCRRSWPVAARRRWSLRTGPGAPLPHPSCCGRRDVRRPNPCPGRRHRSAPDALTRPTAPMGRGDSAGRNSGASGDSRCPGRRHPGRRCAQHSPMPSRRGDVGLAPDVAPELVRRHQRGHHEAHQ